MQPPQCTALEICTDSQADIATRRSARLHQCLEVPAKMARLPRSRAVGQRPAKVSPKFVRSAPVRAASSPCTVPIDFYVSYRSMHVLAKQYRWPHELARVQRGMHPQRSHRCCAKKKRVIMRAMCAAWISQGLQPPRPRVPGLRPRRLQEQPFEPQLSCGIPRAGTTKGDASSECSALYTWLLLRSCS